MVITGHDLLRAPYSHSWEDIQTLKKHCEWYIANWDEWLNKLDHSKENSHLDILNAYSKRYKLSMEERVIKLRKFHAIIKNNKILKYIDDEDEVIRSMLIAWQIHNSISKQRTKAAQMYLLYKEVLDKIKILENERKILGGK